MSSLFLLARRIEMSLRSQNKIVKMNTLQCEVCSLLSPGLVEESATSLLRANEAVEQMPPVYVYCHNCKQHLCKPCDYRIHDLQLQKSEIVGNVFQDHQQNQQCCNKIRNIENQQQTDVEAEDRNKISINFTMNQTQSTMQAVHQNQQQVSSETNSESRANIQETEENKQLFSKEAAAMQDTRQSQLSIDNKKLEHERTQICEECAETHSSSFCPKCEQALCQKCWNRIHNKGARARHRQKSLQKPRIYSPSSWRKASLVNQQSAESSSQQDSLSQFKSEQVQDEIRTDQSAILGSLEVQLSDRVFGQLGTQPQQVQNVSQGSSMPASGQAHPSLEQQQQQFHMQQQVERVQQFQFAQQHSQQFMQFNQLTPPYMSSQQQQTQKEAAFLIYQQQQNQHEQSSQIQQMKATPFHPTQIPGYQGGPYSQHGKLHHHMMQQQFNHPGFHPHDPRGYYVYHADHPPYSNYPPQPYNQQMYGHQLTSPGIPQNYQNLVNQQKQYGHQNKGHGNRSLHSEDDSFSTGILDEATHQVPINFNERDTGYPPHAAYRQGNLNSEPRLQEESEGDHPSLSDNLNSVQSQKIEPYSGSAMQIQNNRNTASNAMSALEQPFASKAFTPLRKGQQSASEYIPSPLMSTPNEQRLKASKMMTPPLIVGGQSRANLKIKSSAVNTSTQYISKGSKPLRGPRDNIYQNTPGCNSSYNNGKPPTGQDKKGPHIAYQIKTGKPNSLSSHEMNSDNSGENNLPPVAYKNHNNPYSRHGGGHLHDQKSFDAYQLGPHQSSSSAKAHNSRTQQQNYNVSGSKKTPNSQSNDYSPRSQQSQHLGGATYGGRHQQDMMYAEYQHENNRKGRKNNTIGSRNFQYHQYGGENSGPPVDYYGKQEHKYHQRGSGADKIGALYKNDSRGSGGTSKQNSLSNYKSGSGGNQSRDSNNYYVVGGAQQKSSANNSSGSRTNPARGSNHNESSAGYNCHHNQHGTPQRTGSTSSALAPVPIQQPVIQQDIRKQAQRRTGEESKSSAVILQNQLEENDLMSKMQHILFENAALGDLLILKSKFVDSMLEKLQMQKSAALKAIDRAVSNSIIHQTDRNFANAQKIEFISLKIQVLSHQCLQWVITSLRRDEMTPTESAIKNRTKEAFDFKLQNDQWEAIMKSIQQDPPRTQQPPEQQNLIVSKRLSITPPDKGSSALIAPKNNQDSSFTQSSAGSLCVAQQQLLITTATTVSAQGITKIVRHTEADTGSGSTQRLRPGNNNSFAGDATGSSEPAQDSQERNLVSDATDQPLSSNNDVSLSAPKGGPNSSSNSTAEVANKAQNPRFKVVLQQSDEDSTASAGPSGASYAIYMGDEEVWTGVDIEDDSTVDRNLYQIMKEFLREYFCAEDQNLDSKIEGKLQHEQRANSEDYTLQGGDLRMIPGGRYGCTQFLKICGPEDIQKCSVGKTTQMVQLAIKEDVLRHLKTQIVWSTQVDKHKTEQDTMEDQQVLVQRKAKLEKVKEAIIEILAESKTGPKAGMSLAQLPQYLKKKLPFNLDWNELGFPKLKDLLNNMDDQIKVELRDVNHPFAYLVHKQRSNQSQHQNQICFDKPMFRENDHLSEQIQDGSTRQMVYDSEKLSQIVQAVFTLLQMHPQGITGSDLKDKVQNQISFEFCFAQLGCHSEYEFVQKYIMPKDDSIEFITITQNRQRTFNIRSRKIFSKFLSQMVKDDQIPMNDEVEQQKKQQQTNRCYPSSLSHKNFNKGPKASNQQNSEGPSDFSSDYQQKEIHQQRMKTHPNERTMPPQSLQQAVYFQTCESIYGSDTQSCGTSLHDQVRAISDLSIDLEIQNKIALTPPLTLQAQKLQKLGETENKQDAGWSHQMMQHARAGGHQQAFHPWYQEFQPQQPVQQMDIQKNQGSQFRAHQGFSNGIFDNLKINSKISGGNSGMTQTPYGSAQLIAGGFLSAIPIDQMDHEEDQQRQQQQHQPQHQQQQSPQNQNAPQHAAYQIFCPLNYGDNDSPRIQETMQHLFDDSPADHPNTYQHYHDQQHEQAKQHQNANAGASDFETQYKSISEGILNQSIFSEGIKQQTKNKLKVEQAAGHKSVELNANQETRGCPREQPSFEEEGDGEIYYPLLPVVKQSEVDQASAKTWQPVSNLSQMRLDLIKHGIKQPQSGQVQIPPYTQAMQYEQFNTNANNLGRPREYTSNDQQEDQKRITEETSGSHHSSTTPVSPDELQKQFVVAAEATISPTNAAATNVIDERKSNQHYDTTTPQQQKYKATTVTAAANQRNFHEYDDAEAENVPFSMNEE